MVLAPLGFGACGAPHEGRDLITIVPADVAGELPENWRDVIAIAPWDPGHSELGVDAIAIAPWDPGSQELPPDAIAIAPWDPGEPPDSNADESVDAETPTDTGPKDAWPELPMDPIPNGYLDMCDADTDCVEEYVCRQVMFCIAPSEACNQMFCIPEPCDQDGNCPEGSTCIPYGGKFDESQAKTCVRVQQGSPRPDGSYGGKCLPDGECLSVQHFCVDACAVNGMICIVPAMTCLPMACDKDKPLCPEDAECRDVGITNACVKKET
jgi:hypothetical protein